VINGVTVAQAIRKGLVLGDEGSEDAEEEEDSEVIDDSSMFVPEPSESVRHV
jgi:hypothetical protein